MFDPTPNNPKVLNVKIPDLVHSSRNSRIYHCVTLEITLEGLRWTYVGSEQQERTSASQPWVRTHAYFHDPLPPACALIETGIRQEFIDHVLRLQQRPSLPVMDDVPGMEDSDVQP
jgi:hypothetical protein